MKPYSDVKIDSSLEPKKFKLLLYLLFIFVDAFPQFYLNGFCKYESFDIPNNFDSFYALNFNADSYNDILLLNNSEYKAATLLGEPEGKFSIGYNSIKLPKITALIPIYDFYGKRYAHIFTSRSERTVGLIKFKGKGSNFISKRLKFQSYPENISVADINRNGRDEVLISGAAFQGLSILLQSESGFIEKKINPSENYSQAIFIDLNSDGYSDIVAFDVNNYSLHYFYNNSRGDFRLERKIVLSQPINNLQTVDFNLDSYPDLLFSFGKSIVIQYGDGTSSFEQQTIIKTNHEVDNFIYGDFNRDGKIGLVYLNKQNSSVSILFKGEEETLQKEFVYFKQKGIVDLIPFYSKFMDGFAVLTNIGKAYFFHNLISFSNFTKLYFGGKPKQIQSFDYADDGINDFCYINSENHSFDMVIRDKSGIPTILYSVPMYLDYSNYKLNDEHPFIKKVYFYNKNERVIGIFEIDLEQFTYKRSYQYTDGNILDIYIPQPNQSQIDEFSVLHIKSGILKVSSFSFKDFRYSVTTSAGISSNVTDARFLSNSSLTFWKYSKGSYFLVHTDKSDYKKEEVIFAYNENKKQPIIRTVFDWFNTDNELMISEISENGNLSIVLNNAKLIDVIPFDETNKSFYDLSGMIFGGVFKPASLNKLFLYLPNEKKLSSVQYLKKKNKLLINEIKTIESLENYIVQRFGANNYYTLYTTKEEKCLVLEKL